MHLNLYFNQNALTSVLLCRYETQMFTQMLQPHWLGQEYIHAALERLPMCPFRRQTCECQDLDGAEFVFELVRSDVPRCLKAVHHWHGKIHQYCREPGRILRVGIHSLLSVYHGDVGELQLCHVCGEDFQVDVIIVDEQVDVSLVDVFVL